MSLEIKISTTFEKAKILVKQIKALGFSQAGLPLELNASMSLEGMSWALWQRQQKERIPLGFWSHRVPLGFWKGQKTNISP